VDENRSLNQLADGLWHWQAKHPEWSQGQPWDKFVSSYAVEDDGRLLLIDPLGVPAAIIDLAKERETIVVLTAPWHERDTKQLVEQLGVPVYTPLPDSAQDLIDKFGITAEQAGDGSPDLVWLLKESGGEAHPYKAGDVMADLGIEAFAGREANDMVLWFDSCQAVISGDTLVDFGRGYQIANWLRAGMTKKDVADGLRPLLAKPVIFVLPTHGTPTTKEALETALS
jgi:hypothetical protein